MQIGMEPLVIDWAKEEAKSFVIFMFIANKSIFKSITSYLFSQVNSSEGVPPNYILKKSFYSFLKIRKNVNLMVKPL